MFGILQEEDSRMSGVRIPERRPGAEPR